ncbi:hypothetical protein L6654_30930 [Bradyrhizobium sp. WYCCWR 13023]|uniref:Uncharacterized protein n=1 Tax=Bradyrhizobium zhengyangense TaxID=2911009 RepID=A0A9X1RE42_9BRAD|nr:hypothetical protein [Bradyrhizobium zhengyangense]MCG2631054.1 hypothetical protein [Bradyrhizobium zhengyangense]
MTHAAVESSQGLSDQDLDSVSGGMILRMGPIHLNLEAGYFSFGVGNSGVWLDGTTGSAGAGVGKSVVSIG